MAKRSRSEDESVIDEDGVAPGSRSPDEEHFAHTPKYVEMEDISSATAMRCILPPHKSLSFATYGDYETHYQQAHTNRCSECRKNFPTSHFLELHIAELHDPIVATRRDKGEKTYACYVEDCDKLCRDWTKRRSHLVDKHGFPRNYDFFVVNNGIDGRRSMLRPGVDAQGHRRSSRERRVSSATEDTESTEATSVSRSDETERNTSLSEGGTKAAVDDLTNSMSSLKMVPRSITFGKRKGRAGLAKS